MEFIRIKNYVLHTCAELKLLEQNPQQEQERYFQLVPAVTAFVK